MHFHIHNSHINKKENDEDFSAEFLIRPINDDVIWEEEDVHNSFWPEGFFNSYKQFFRLKSFVYGADLKLDVTFLNQLNKPVVIITVGVEILEAAHEMYFYGIPRAAKIRVLDEFVLEMPDIHYEWHHGVGAERPPFDKSKLEIWLAEATPRVINRVVSKSIPEPVYVEHLAPYRFRLIFHKYQKNVPNHAIFRLFFITNIGRL